MRTIYVSFIILIISQSLQGQTNNYHPMPTSGAIWREYFGGYEVNCRDYQITITGDTIIGDKTYQKLQEFGVNIMNVSGNCLAQYWNIYDVYVGAYRNDIIGKKVYFIPSGSAIEELLYDFNLELNDKLPETYRYYSTTDTSYISQIDSILIGNEYRKRYQVSNSTQIGYVSLIEGIGSTFGLLADLNVPFEFGSMLLCYKQNDVTVYPDQSYECILVTGIDDPVKNSEVFSISPSPIIAGVGVINMPKLAQPSILLVFDILGNEIMKIPGVEQGTILHAEQLKQGMYLYQVKSGNQVYFTGKFLVGSK